jgi:molybdopterin converting factor small subunit
MASEFDAFSDARIKNVVGTSNSFEDLSTLLDIEITDYTMVDKAKDIKPYKKVIAQQVEQVYPSAVSQITDVVPDIYTVSSIKDGYVSLATDLKDGDKVKLIFDEGAEMATVTSTDANGFTVNLEKTGNVFVYGREVNDFRTVDYEAISMLNVSATQELFKLITTLQEENTSLKADVSQLKSMSTDIEILKEAMGIDLKASK